LKVDLTVKVTHIPSPTAFTSPKFILSKFSFLTIPSDTSKFSLQQVGSAIILLLGAEGS
jgi:hypothetical protein